jgi:putative membrane protein
VIHALLDEHSEAAVKQRVAALEAATGVETVVAVIARADSYPEIPWKAFALGASLAALAAAVAALREPEWEALAAVVETTIAILAAGGAAAIATIWVEPLARLFLPRSRRESEVLQYAQALFLESGLLRTERRNAVLLLVSRFEHQVAIVADHGVRDRVGAIEFDSVIAAVTTQLARGQLKEALVDGLGRLEQVLLAQGFRARADATNEISDAVIQRQGAS